VSAGPVKDDIKRLSDVSIGDQRREFQPLIRREEIWMCILCDFIYQEQKGQKEKLTA